MVPALRLSAQGMRPKADMKDFGEKIKRKAPRASRKKKALRLDLKGLIKKALSSRSFCLFSRQVCSLFTSADLL